MFHNRQTLNGTTYSRSHSIRFHITSRVAETLGVSAVVRHRQYVQL